MAEQLQQQYKYHFDKQRRNDVLTSIVNNDGDFWERYNRLYAQDFMLGVAPNNTWDEKNINRRFGRILSYIALREAGQEKFPDCGYEEIWDYFNKEDIKILRLTEEDDPNCIKSTQKYTDLELERIKKEEPEIGEFLRLALACTTSRLNQVNTNWVKLGMIQIYDLLAQK